MPKAFLTGFRVALNLCTMPGCPADFETLTLRKACVSLQVAAEMSEKRLHHQRMRWRRVAIARKLAFYTSTSHPEGTMIV